MGHGFEGISFSNQNVSHHAPYLAPKQPKNQTGQAKDTTGWLGALALTAHLDVSAAMGQDACKNKTARWTGLAGHFRATRPVWRAVCPDLGRAATGGSERAVSEKSVGGLQGAQHPLHQLLDAADLVAKRQFGRAAKEQALARFAFKRMGELLVDAKLAHV